MLTFVTSGSFSEVLVDRQNGLCCKILSEFAIKPHVPDRELAILLWLQDHKHENVIELVRHEHSPATGGLSLWFPYYEWSLLDYVENVHSPNTTKVVFDLANGLSHLHRLGIIHRDVCPNNVVVDVRQNNPCAILLDLGIAFADHLPFGEARHSLISAVGTGSFRAPELLFGDTDYNESIDMWAFGCTVYQIIHPKHQTLFDAGEGASELALLASIFRKLGTPSMSSWVDASRLSGFANLQFKVFEPIPWPTLLPAGSDILALIIKRSLVFNTRERLQAGEVSSLPRSVRSL